MINIKIKQAYCVWLFLFPQCSFDSNKNKHSYYRGKVCMKKFCEDLRKYETEIITHKKRDVTANERRKRITLHKFVIYVKKS